MESIEQTATDLLDKFVQWVNAFMGDIVQGDVTNITLWLAVATGVYFGIRTLQSIIAGLFKSKKRPPNSIRNIIGHVIGATNSLFLIPLSLVVTLPFFEGIPENYELWLKRIFIVTIILQAAFWLRIVAQAFLEGAVLDHAEEDSSLSSARSLISLFVNVAIFAIAIIMIIDNLGGNVTGLIAGLGVGGIAIGLAAQNIFEDLFASLSIILDKPFTKGDFVSFNGFNGNIERIGLKTTRIKALSGEQIVVSNSNLLSNEIQNFKRMNERRGTFTVGVTYQTPHSALEALPSRLEDLIENQGNCRFDRSHLSGYGASSIDFTTVYYVLSRDYKEFMDVQHAILLKVHALFEDMGIEFAYPTQTIFVERDAVEDNA